MLTKLLRRRMPRRSDGARWELRSDAMTLPPPAQRLTPAGAFIPALPQNGSRGFVGRTDEMRRIREVLEEDHGNVVLYAERGRGKTSLANLVVEQMRSAGHMVARHTCDAGSDFEGVLRGLMRDLPAAFLASPVRDPESLEGCEAVFPEGPLRPRDVLAAPGRLTGGQVILVIDEFDRVEDVATRTALADTIKQVSDRRLPLSFLIVGVSASLEELIGHHPSIQRSLIGIPLPLLSDAEIELIVKQGGAAAGMHFIPAVRTLIVRQARGVPYIAHLLGLLAVRVARQEGRLEVEVPDLLVAVRQAVQEFDPHTGQLYDTLTRDGMDPAMAQLLQTIAEGPQDGFGAFLMEDAEGELRVAGLPANPSLWARIVDAGCVRGDTGSRVFFSDSLFRSYVLLRSGA